jgi:cobalt-zinc-cadmium resistance protein CzcA
MLEKIVIFSVRRRWLVFALALLLVGLGIYQATQLPIDAVPDITNKQVQINSKVHGLDAEEMERQVTFPLEMALSGMPFLSEIRSISQFGLSQITVVFEDHVNLYFARQLVAERLAEAKESLPTDVVPQMAPVSTGLGEIYYLRIENPALTLMEKRTLLDWVVRPQLRAVPGLAEINTWGGLLRQYQVLIDPQKLLAYGLSTLDVLNALQAGNRNAGGAFLPSGAEQKVIRSEGQIRSLEDIKKIVVSAKGGTPITLDRVATIQEGGALRQGAITENGQGEEAYAISMLLIGENARTVTHRIKDKQAQIERSLPQGSRLVGFLDRSALIESTLKTATRNLTEGGLLVIILLLLFLMQLRAGLIVGSLIPLSMLFAIIGMRAFSVSANLMSLGAIDFGLIVDGAVIIVENTVRRLAQAARAPLSLSRDERHRLVCEATLEVLRPSLFGVSIILTAYIPILALTGIEGKMFRPMGLTVIFALVGALLLSMTLVPALCTQFLRAQPEKENPILHRLYALYPRLLQALMPRKFLVYSFAAAFVMGCLSMFPKLGSEFIPELAEGDLAVQATYLPSLSLESVIERSGVLERYLLEQFPDEIARIVTRIGRPEVATDPMLINQTDALIELKPQSFWKKAFTQKELSDKVADALQSMPGVSVSLTQPIKMRMSELIEGVGIRADFAVKLFGPDLAILAREGQTLKQLIESVPGAADVNVEITQGQPQLKIKPKRDALARYGLHMEEVNSLIETALGGRIATVVKDGSQQIDTVVRFAENQRATQEQIARLRVPIPSGGQIPLRELAELQVASGPVQISRESGQRRVVVQANVRGRDLGSFVQEVRQQIETLSLPPGYWLEYGGTYEHLQSGRARLVIVVPLTFAGILMLLMIALGGIKPAVLVFTGIPFALTGGILALWLREIPFSISAGIGFIALGGVAVLNGLVMVSFIQQLRSRGVSVREAVLEGASARLRPVLMTASVAGIGFLPMALSHGAGAEVQRPLATVVIGGLITSTLLTLLVLPLLYEGTMRDEASSLEPT